MRDFNHSYAAKTKGAAMPADYLSILSSLFGALVAGGVIGLERSFHGRPAGFRTHTLVCLASSLLMLVTLYQWQWLPGVALDTIRTDPTRMAQGIMTGIGFLGAGVIFKEGLSVRGLTTAASIWITAAIGILLGIGFIFPAVVGTLLTIGILSLFRLLEAKLPSHFYAHAALRFDQNNTPAEQAIRALVTENGFTIANMSYHLHAEDLTFEYRMVIQTRQHQNLANFAEQLRQLEHIRGFRIAPTGD